MIIKPVLLIRANGNEQDAKALAELGVSAVIDPFLKISANPDPSNALNLYSFAQEAEVETWVVATSRNGIDYWAETIGESKLRSVFKTNKKLRFAAIGPSTGSRLYELGAAKVTIPPEPNAQSLLEALGTRNPARAIIPIGNLTLNTLPRGLAKIGWEIIAREVYQNSIVERRPKSVAGIEAGDFGAIILRSPSAVRAFLHFVPKSLVPLICGGRTTAAELEIASLVPAEISDLSDSNSLAKLALKALCEKGIR